MTGPTEQHLKWVAKIAWKHFPRIRDKAGLIAAGQDGLLKAHAKYDSKRGEYKPFACRVIRNEMISWIRKNNRHVRTLSFSEYEHSGGKPLEIPWQAPSLLDVQDELEYLLRELDEDTRELLLWKYGHGLTLKEIAQQRQGMKSTTIFDRLEKAMTSLRLRSRSL